MKIIDAHIHVFEKPYSDVFENSHINCGENGELHLYEEYRKKYDIESAFVICYDEGHCPENSAYVKMLLKKRPWIYSLGYARPGKPFQSESEKAVCDGHFGVSCYLDKNDSGIWLEDSDISFMLRENIPLNLTIWPHQCTALHKLLDKFPEAAILINHMGRPSFETLKDYDKLLGLSEFENVYVKLSGFYAFSREGWRSPQRDLFWALDRLKDSFSAERLLFASDFSPVLEFNTYKQTLETLRDYNAFSEDELEKIYYLNAKKIIKKRERNDS